jgi:hypothetical protein
MGFSSQCIGYRKVSLNYPRPHLDLAFVFYRGAFKLSRPIRRLIPRVQNLNYSMFSHFGYEDTLQPSKSLSSRSNLPR